jgi:hypothetical protein
MEQSTQDSTQDCWSAYIFFNKINYFMVKITTRYFFSFSIISWSKSILFFLSGGRGRQVPTGKGRTLSTVFLKLVGLVTFSLQTEFGAENEMEIWPFQ